MKNNIFSYISHINNLANKPYNKIKSRLMHYFWFIAFWLKDFWKLGRLKKLANLHFGRFILNKKTRILCKVVQKSNTWWRWQSIFSRNNLHVAATLGRGSDVDLLPRDLVPAWPASGWDQRALGSDGWNGILVSRTAHSTADQVQHR